MPRRREPLRNRAAQPAPTPREIATPSPGRSPSPRHHRAADPLSAHPERGRATDFSPLARPGEPSRAATPGPAERRRHARWASRDRPAYRSTLIPLRAPFFGPDGGFVYTDP